MGNDIKSSDIILFFKDIHIFPNAYGTSENRIYFNTLLKNKHSEFFFL